MIKLLPMPCLLVRVHLVPESHGTLLPATGRMRPLVIEKGRSSADVGFRLRTCLQRARGDGQDRVRGVREASSSQMHRLPLGKAACQMKTDQAGGNSGECGRPLLRPSEAVRDNFDGVLRHEAHRAVDNRCAPTPWG